MATVHLVEDDQAIREALARVLADRGHVVRSSGTGHDAVRAILDEPCDVVVLDLGLPDIDGATVLGMIRSVLDPAVIVATARDDERAIVRLLDAGADDYVVKPYSADQLEARIRAVLRRRGGPVVDDTLVVGELTIDVAGRTVRLGDEELELSRKEFDLLAHLARNVGTVVTREQLLAQVWHQPLGGGDKTLDVHLSWLRRKLGESAREPRYLHTVRGVGVKLVDPGS